ncbi:MAG: hypothetical protein ACYCY6_02305 [Minisyncoccota bacterium]
MLKAIQIFLGVLIIIGVILLFSQKLWVPKITDFILEYENNIVQASEK